MRHRRCILLIDVNRFGRIKYFVYLCIVENKKRKIIMKKLSEKFSGRRDGSMYFYKLVERYFIKEDCEVAIYAVAHSEEALEKYPYFEGFRIDIVNKYKYIDGKYIKTDEFYERYPQDSQFGDSAFTSPKIEILKEILNKRFNK